MVVIFFASSLPKQVSDGAGSELYFSGIMPVFPDPWELILKKSAHLMIYAALALLTLRALVVGGWSRDAALLGALAIAICYAGSDEFHQSFVSGRGASLRDVAIDTAGALLALAGAGWGFRMRDAHRAGPPTLLHETAQSSNKNSRPL